MRKEWIVILICLSCFRAWGQIGGNTPFRFLSLPVNAKTAALGGVNISATKPEVSQLQDNPALLQANTEQQVAFGFTDYIADISYSNLSYAFKPAGNRRWGAGISYFNYGDFIQRDATGQETGKFSVHDYAIGVTHASTLDNFTLGASVKMAVSTMAEFRAIALLTDLGGIFKHPEKDLAFALAIKNIGYELKSYSGLNRRPTPLDIQLGITYKPEHMPFRFSVTAHNLQKFDIVYLDTANSNVFGQNTRNQKSIGDKIASHFVIGGELLLSKNFNVRAGYNHLRRSELRLESASGMSGFSLGALLRIKQFQLDYAHAFYHAAGASNYFTLSTNLKQIFKTKSSSNTSQF